MTKRTPNKITEVTRRAIFDRLTVEKYPWHGRLDEVEFLSRLYNLAEIPSTDYRFEDASGEIWQHTVNNPGDWSHDWVFNDSRFDLLRGPDETFLKFLCEMVHPVIRPKAEEAERLVSVFNSHLITDGWEITEATRISNKPVYAARPVLDGAGVSVAAAKEIAAVLDADYVSQQITRMEAAVDRDSELAIGTAKEFIETICKTILTEQCVSFAKDESLPKLVKLALGSVALLPDGIKDSGKAEENIRILVNNLGSVGHQLAELRNQFGTGHGKDAKHGRLARRHARLAVNAASTLGVFLFECHRDTREP